MQISKDEALRLAFSLDVAITVLEWESDPHARPPGLTARAADEALIHLRQIRSAALRANREPPDLVPTAEEIAVRLGGK